jgi:hypothetical protein
MTKLRKIAVAVSTAAMFFGVLPQALAGSIFSDVADTNEFAVFIHDLQAQGIVSGVGTTGMYMPERNVTRGEMMKMVINAMKKSGEGKSALTDVLNTPALPGAPHFEDVPAGSSFYDQVEMAYALGIVNGRRAPAEGVQGSFGVNEPVLRQEAMKMVVGAYRKVAADTFMQDLTGGPSFDDVSASSEFYDFIQTAYNLAIVNGYGNSKFGPMDPMRRDQMAKVISNTMKVFTTGKPLSVGVPARVQVDNSDPQIKNDGTSTATITCTIVDRNGNRVGDWSDPVSFTTDAGSLSIVGGSEAAAMTKTVNTNDGRGQITLISSTTAGTATITCRTGSMEGTTRVEFTADAPGVRNGFGSAAISGVGELHVRATDNHIVASRQNAPAGSTAGAGSVSITPVSGFSTIEAFVYDDAGDPSCGDTLVYSIRSGNGHLQDTIPTTAQAAAAARSLTLDASDCMNGRYVGYLNILSTQNSGPVVVQVLDRSTSPSLITQVTVQIDLVKLDAKVYDNSILTRNSRQITDVTATEQNIAPVLIKTLDENNRPFQTADNSADVDQIECRLVSGATSSALLDGVSNSDTGGRIRGTVVQADYVEGSAGIYALNVIAGSASGSLTVRCRDLDAIGQPEVSFNVTVRQPQVELFVSSARARASTLTTVVARIRDGSKPVTGEELRLQIDGGDGRVGVGGTYTYGAANENSAVMDHICYVNAGGTISSNLLIPGGSLGQVTIRPFGTACVSGEVDSGWYTAKVYMPLSTTERDQTINLRATDLSRAEQPQGQVTVVATRGLPSEARQLTVMPMSQEVGINQDIPTIIFVQDSRGFGLSCTSTGSVANANNEAAADAQSGCTVPRNGLTPGSETTIGINRTTVVPGLAGYLSVNPTTSENVYIYTRGNSGAAEASQFFIVNNLGGGAYFMAARAKDRADRAEWRVELHDSSGVEIQAPLVQVNIVPNRVTTEFNLSTTIPDWNNTLIAFVRDQNNDPVTTLSNERVGGAFPTNNFTAFAVTRSGSDVADIQPNTNVGLVPAGASTDLLHDGTNPVGSGLYLFNVDTINSTSVGTVSIKVSLNQATNPESTASYRVQDPSIQFDAWPNRLSSSNVVPLTVIVTDDQGTPLALSASSLVQVEVTRGSGNLEGTNAVSPSSGLRVDLADIDDGVFVGSYKASSVTESVDLVARLNAISSRTEDRLSLSVN